MADPTQEIVAGKLRIMEMEQRRLHDSLMRQRESGQHCCLYCGGRDLEFEGSFENEGTRFYIVRCCDCELSQLDKRNTLEATKAFEDENEFYDPVPAEQVEETIKNYVYVPDLLGRFIATPGRVLDVGCSNGYSLAAAKRAGWEVQGLDLSARSCRFAREVLDVPVFEGTLEAYVPDAPFDAIVGWHVIEHVPSLQSFLEHLNIFLKLGGHLFLQVPSFRHYRTVTPWEDYTENFNPVHFWYFEPETLSALVTQYGFEASEVLDDPQMRMLTVIARKVSELETAPESASARELRS